MALTNADYYWVDTFRSIQQQTDHEIETLNSIGPQARRVFASSLVEAQRTSDDLEAHFRSRKSKEIDSILGDENFKALFEGTVVTAEHLGVDAILRIFTSNAVKQVACMGSERDIQIRLFRDALDTSELDEDLSDQLGCLVKYIRDVFQERDSKEERKPKTTLELTSPEKFLLEDVPRTELQKRLNRGEIAPRDEWIPSEDKTNKKLISGIELRARLTFGERLMTEAKAAMATNDWELASTLYTQGVHLLDQYKCEATADACDLSEWLNRFRRNNAVATLKLGRYRQSIASSTEALEGDPHDGKARFLRAKGYMAVGDLQAAEFDLESLRTDGFASDAHRKAGQEGLRRLRLEAKRDRVKVATLIQGVTDETCFSSGRASDTTFEDTPNAERREQIPLPRASRKEEELPMSPEMYIKLLETVLRAYTFPAVAERLEALRHSVDYDERRIIIKLEAVLPDILMPILKDFGILESCDDYTMKKKELHRIIGIFQTSSQIADSDRKVARSLLKCIREALVGGEETSA